MTLEQDLSHYDPEYYKRDQTFARHRVLRPDQLAALCYTLDWPYWGLENSGEDWVERQPGVVLSIGCGRGELERELECLGCTVVGVDPSAGAQFMYQGSRHEYRWTRELVRSAGTIIWCESLEHIPWSETLELLGHVRKDTRLIFVNFVDFWPLEVSGDGWDHITRVDDALYDGLSEGRCVVLRRASHLVLDW